MAKKTTQNWWRQKLTLFLPLLMTYNKTKTTIGFPVISCIEKTPFICKNINLKIWLFLPDLNLILTWPSPESYLNRLWWSSNRFHWVGNEKLAIKHASRGPIKIGFMCWPLVTCPLWPDLIWVTSISNMGTRQLTLYRLFLIKFVLLDVITHSIDLKYLLTFDLTCDVISDPEVNEISLPSRDIPGLSNAVWIL